MYSFRLCCYIHKYLWQSSDSVLIQAGQFNTASDEHEGGGSRPALSLCPEDLVLLSFFPFTRREKIDREFMNFHYQYSESLSFIIFAK